MWGAPRVGQRSVSGADVEVSAGAAVEVMVGSARVPAGVAAADGSWPTRSRLSLSGRPVATPFCELVCSGDGNMGGLCKVLLTRGAVATAGAGWKSAFDGSRAVGSSGADADGRMWVSFIDTAPPAPPPPGPV
jgi:hypothetical protein